MGTPPEIGYIEEKGLREVTSAAVSAHEDVMADPFAGGRRPGGVGRGLAQSACLLLALNGAAAQEATSGNAEKRLDRAREYLVSGRLDRAEKEVERALAEFPASADAHRLLCDIRSVQQRRQDAISACQHAVDLAPGRADLLVDLGDLLRQREDATDAALRAYRRAAEIDVDDPLPHVHIGSILENRDQLVEAEAEYQKALALNPNLVRANAGLGAVLFKTDRPDRAMHYLSRAIELRPRDLRSHVFLGLALNHGGQLDLALQELRSAVAIDPHAANAASGVQEERERFEKLRAHFLKELETNELDASYAHNVAITSYFLRDYEMAWSYMVRAQRLGYPVDLAFKEVVYSRWKSGSDGPGLGG